MCLEIVPPLTSLEAWDIDQTLIIADTTRSGDKATIEDMDSVLKGGPKEDDWRDLIRWARAKMYTYVHVKEIYPTLM
jgi:hypothetical protein